MNPLHAKGYQGQIPPQAKAPQPTQVDKKVQDAVIKLKEIWGDNFNVVSGKGTTNLQVEFINIPIASQKDIIGKLKTKQIYLKDGWQVRNNENGTTCTVTLRNYEASRLLGYTEGTKPEFDEVMKKIKNVKDAHGNILASKEENIIPKEEKNNLAKLTSKLGSTHISKEEMNIYSDTTNLSLRELRTKLDSTLIETESGWNFKKGTNLKMFESLQIFTGDELNPHALNNLAKKLPQEDKRREAAWALSDIWSSRAAELQSVKNALTINLNGITAQGGTTSGNSDFLLITFKLLSALHNIPIQTYFSNDNYSFLFIPFKNEQELNQISKVLIGIVGMIKENPVGAFLGPLVNNPGKTITVNNSSFAPTDRICKCKYDQFSNGFKLTLDGDYEHLAKYCSRAFENQFPGKLTQTKEGNSISLIVTP